jgi:hypothetical protein
MRKKEPWMFNGAIVLALGKKAVINAMQQNRINDVDYVYNIDARLEGEKKAGTYHPNDISELKIPAA